MYIAPRVSLLYLSWREIWCQLHEALLDASRQRARRIEADARLMEKRTGEVGRAKVKEDVVNSQKAVEETRARLAGEMDNNK